MEILDLLGKSIGISRNRATRTAFMKHAKDLNLIKQKVQRIGVSDNIKKSKLSGTKEKTYLFLQNGDGLEE